MDLNDNQPINTNPLQQPAAPQPVAPTAPPPPQPTTPSTPPAQPIQTTVTPQNPPITPKSNKKILILLALLILLIVGIGGYVFFAKNQMNNKQKAATDNQSVVIPTATTAPTVAPEDDLEIASPEADLSDIEQDLQGL